MTKRICTCDRIPLKGQPYSSKYCLLCYQYHRNPEYRKLFDGEGEIPIAQDTRTKLTEGPNWLQKAINFAGATVSHVWAGLPETPTEEQERRLAICLQCPSKLFDTINGVCLHKKCGCQMTRKVAWLDQSCPQKHW